MRESCGTGDTLWESLSSAQKLGGTNKPRPREGPVPVYLRPCMAALCLLKSRHVHENMALKTMSYFFKI